MTKGFKVRRVTKIQKPNTEVFDIEVEDAHHYILEDGTVSHNSYVPTKEMSGGAGLKFSASNIIFLSKKKDRDTSNTKDILGNFITCTLVKGRLTKENKSVTVKLSYESGLDKYYGLVDLAVKHDVFKKVSTRIELPDGSKVFEKNIYEDPEKFFTEDVLEQLNQAAHKEFMYGSSKGDSNEDVEENSEHICEEEES